MFLGGDGLAGLPYDSHKEDRVKRVQRGMHCSLGGGGALGQCRTCLRGTQQRTGGCRGTARREECRSYVAGSARGGGERRTDDVRGSEVLCLRHGGRLREAGEDTQHGSILSQETLVHPPQALDLSQSRESLHRGGERYRGGQTEKACREAGCVQRERLIQRYIHTHTGMCPHTHTERGKQQQI